VNFDPTCSLLDSVRFRASGRFAADRETKLPPVMGEALRKRRHGLRRGHSGSGVFVIPDDNGSVEITTVRTASARTISRPGFRFAFMSVAPCRLDLFPPYRGMPVISEREGEGQSLERSPNGRYRRPRPSAARSRALAESHSSFI
jgi:hypothetical protein